MNYVTVRPTNGMRMAGDFDRLFDSVFGSSQRWETGSPAVDIRAEDDRYVVEADLPGMSEDQISIKVENDLLVIAGEQTRADNGKKSENYIVRERASRSFRRSFAMPKDGDATNIEASFKNGVLSVNIFKRPESKPRQIEIKRG